MMEEYVIHHVNVVNNGKLYATNLTQFRNQFMVHFNVSFMVYNDIMTKCLDVYIDDGGTYFSVKIKKNNILS